MSFALPPLPHGSSRVCLGRLAPPAATDPPAARVYAQPPYHLAFCPHPPDGAFFFPFFLLGMFFKEGSKCTFFFFFQLKPFQIKRKNYL
jgi:hypothetical protein